MLEDDETDPNRPCGVRWALGVGLLILRGLGGVALDSLEVLEVLEAFLGDDLVDAMMLSAVLDDLME